MKTIKHMKLGACLLLSCLLPLPGCVGDRDTPEAPDTDLVANITIKELLEKYKAYNYCDIDEDLYIEGVVVGNDISGNIYKKIYLQDDYPTPEDSINIRGIDIEIEMTNNHHKYPVGQRLVVELKGLAYGLYSGQPQIAGRGENVTRRLYEAECNQHLHRKGYASAATTPAPKVLTLNQISLDYQRMQYVGRLVRVNNVEFEDAGLVYANANNGSAESHNLKDDFNNTLILRNSASALFANDTMPSGKVCVQGILGIYKTTSRTDMQLYIRDINDVIILPSQEEEDNQ
ncbi:MAG: hypothetical protein K2O66_07475 [Bacteroidales bacterium]|nr:hypothetical protein [Bacteroidales bacterium]MDE7073184.1 hypothetical protein [Bacteroidales bacterium]